MKILRQETIRDESWVREGKMGKGYRDLVVWNESMNLVVVCYDLAKGFPSAEKFGLTSNFLRSAVSIPSNIAEGQARRSQAEYHHHVSYAYGSLAELETQVELAFRLGYCREEDYVSIIQRCGTIGRMLKNLLGYLDRNRN
jgi:four helix bundle protein